MFPQQSPPTNQVQPTTSVKLKEPKGVTFMVIMLLTLIIIVAQSGYLFYQKIQLPKENTRLKTKKEAMLKEFNSPQNQAILAAANQILAQNKTLIEVEKNRIDFQQAFDLVRQESLRKVNYRGITVNSDGKVDLSGEVENSTEYAYLLRAFESSELVSRMTFGSYSAPSEDEAEGQEGAITTKLASFNFSVYFKPQAFGIEAPAVAANQPPAEQPPAAEQPQAATDTNTPQWI